MRVQELALAMRDVCDKSESRICWMQSEVAESQASGGLQKQNMI